MALGESEFKDQKSGLRAHFWEEIPFWEINGGEKGRRARA